MYIFTQPIGTTKRHQLDLPTEDGTEPGYTGSEAVTASAWPGDGRGSVALGAGWVTAPFRVYLEAGDTADGLPIGRYKVQVKIDGEWVADAWLDLVGAPADEPAEPTYATYKDLLRVAPWVAGLQQTGDGSQAGHADVLAESRRSLDSLILAKHARKSRSDRVETGEFLLQGGDRYSEWLRARLAAGALVLTTERGRRLIEAQAHDAAARIARRTWLASGQKESAAKATYHGRAASSIYVSGVAELDTNGDSMADLFIHLGGFGT